MITPYQIFGILGSLVLSAFFSGIEIAFLAADKLGIELYGERKALAGKVLVGFLKRPNYFITTTLIGNTIALVIYGASMASILEPLLHAYLPSTINSNALRLILQTLLSTFGILVFAEFIPKSIFLRSPNRLLAFFALPTAAIAYLLHPLVAVTTAIAKFFIVHVLGQEYQETQPVFGLTDLHTFIKNSLNLNQKLPVGVSARIVSNLIEFRKIKVRDCMTPRKEIIAVNITGGIEALRQTVAKSDHAKILVYRNDIDDIIGYCHSKELFKKPKHIESILTPAIIVSEANLASEVMVRLKTEGKSLALVVDEFGGTSGIVSMEDIIEEIVGEIQDEHDVTELLEQKLDECTYLLSARHEINYLNETYNWDIPQGDYDTLGGFIISVTERIPELNETVHIEPFSFTILSIEDTHINTVKVQVSKSVEEG